MGAGSVAEAVRSGGLLVGVGVSVGAGADGVAVTGADVAVVVGSGAAVGASVVAVELVAVVGLLMLAVGDVQPTRTSRTSN